MIAAVYWCIHKRTGAVLICLSPFSTWLGDAVKYTFNIPRPADPRLRLQWVELTPSFLSGHSLSAVALFGFVAVRLCKLAVTVICAIVIAGIAASRMFLGFHFPQDVIGGLGLAPLIAVYFGGSLLVGWIAPGGLAYPVELGVALVRYGLVGWTLTFGAPWLFCRAGLAGWEGAERVALD